MKHESVGAVHTHTHTHTHTHGIILVEEKRVENIYSKNVIKNRFLFSKQLYFVY